MAIPAAAKGVVVGLLGEVGAFSVSAATAHHRHLTALNSAPII